MDRHEDIFDIAKLILSVFVVGIHANAYPEIMNPLYRTAVPLFFMMSSYFFFRSAARNETANHKRIKKFVIRNLRLYGFWFAALFPLTLKIRNYFAEGFAAGLLNLMHNFFFYSTFRASWYLIALCTAMTMFYYLSRKLSNKCLLCISVPIYLLYCLFSNYYGLLSGWSCWNSFCSWYRSVFLTLCNNFPAAFLWLVFGKMFAERKIEISAKRAWWMLLGSVLLLYMEQTVVLLYGFPDKTDYYLGLVPFCLALFSLLCGADVQCRMAPLLRKTSTVMYVLHSSAMSVLNVVGKRLFAVPEHSMPVFLMISSVGVCIAATLVISCLEQKRGFRWLKYAY